MSALRILAVVWKHNSESLWPRSMGASGFLRYLSSQGASIPLKTSLWPCRRESRRRRAVWQAVLGSNRSSPVGRMKQVVKQQPSPVLISWAAPWANRQWQWRTFLVDWARPALIYAQKLISIIMVMINFYRWGVYESVVCLVLQFAVSKCAVPSISIRNVAAASSQLVKFRLFWMNLVGFAYLHLSTA